jgi:hypothetical protein
MYPGYEEQSGEPKGPRFDRSKQMMMSSARQQDNESLAEYYKSFTSCVDVGESEWGTPVPAAAATNETNERTSRDKFITCVFLQEWIPKGMES